jgi:hypothetical protein
VVTSLPPHLDLIGARLHICEFLGIKPGKQGSIAPLKVNPTGRENCDHKTLLGLNVLSEIL